MKNRAVLTGMGMVSPMGFGVEENWCKINRPDGKLCEVNFSTYHLEDPPDIQYYEVDKNRVKEYFPSQLMKRMDYFIAYALIASKEAIQKAQLDQEIKENAQRIGVSIGSTFGGMGFAERESLRFKQYVQKHCYPKISPYLSIAMFQCAASGQVSILNGLQGKIYSIPNGNTSGIDTIINAVQCINTNNVDVMLVGSSEAPITPFCLSSLFELGKLSQEGPDHHPYIFSEQNKGFFLGEGSGMLVIENYAYAQKRKAKIYAEILGCYSTMDKDVTIAGKRCLEKIFKRYDIQKKDIDLIMAYGEGTSNDKKEIEILASVFGEELLSNIPITANKCIMGHALAASSAFDMILGNLCMQYNHIFHMNQGDDRQLINENQWNYVKNKKLQKDIRCVLCYAISFGGNFSAVIFRKMD
ncbi:beta-ketoacyl synthase N-terminal-like domain-containing protein [Desulforamulus ruminis]